MIQGVRGKEASWTDGTPDHAGVEVGAGEGAGEAVGGFVGADVGDVSEGPVEDADLAEGAHDDAYALDEEELTGGDLKEC